MSKNPWRGRGGLIKNNTEIFRRHYLQTGRRRVRVGPIGSIAIWELVVDLRTAYLQRILDNAMNGWRNFAAYRDHDAASAEADN